MKRIILSKLSSEVKQREFSNAFVSSQIHLLWPLSVMIHITCQKSITVYLLHNVTAKTRWHVCSDRPVVFIENSLCGGVCETRPLCGVRASKLCRWAFFPHSIVNLMTSHACTWKSHANPHKLFVQDEWLESQSTEGPPSIQNAACHFHLSVHDSQRSLWIWNYLLHRKNKPLILLLTLGTFCWWDRKVDHLGQSAKSP